MAIAVVGGDAIATTGAAPSRSLPGGIAPDHVVVALSTRASNQDPAISSAGYTLMINTQWGYSAHGSKLSLKKMGASPDSVVASNGDSFAAGLAFIAYSGVNASTPQDATCLGAVATGTVTPPAITTVTNGAEVICTGGKNNDSSGVPTISGFGNTQSAHITGSSGRHMSLGILSKNKATAGTETPGAIGGTDWNAAVTTVGLTAALRPAAPAAAASLIFRPPLQRFHHMLVR